MSLSIGIIDWLDHQTSGSHPLITHYCVSRLAGFQHQLSPRFTLWLALSWRITLVVNLVNHLCRIGTFVGCFAFSMVQVCNYLFTVVNVLASQISEFLHVEILSIGPA
jgi:hypothetical protein